MTNTQTTFSNMQVIAPLQDPAIDYQAALYFLDGHFLFRSRERGGWQSKFVTIADVQAAFIGKEQDSGWLPAGVVRAGSNKAGKWFVYSAPSQKVSIRFDGEDQAFKIPLPRTLLLGVGSEYYLWALTGQFFDPHSIAHAAPFPNVHANGKVCWGDNTPPKAEPERARAVWDLFFESAFNNHLIDRKSKAFPEDVREQLRSLAGKREYPAGDLCPTGTQVHYVIDSILKR